MESLLLATAHGDDIVSWWEKIDVSGEAWRCDLVMFTKGQNCDCGLTVIFILSFSFLFSQEFSGEDYLAIVNGWREKLARSKTGDQRWGLFHATKN